MQRISVRNFQSLKKVDLDLGRFTVIVGPSSSGKTALARALRVLISNVRGSDFVSRGQRAAVISARVGDSVVSLLRGEGIGKYQVKVSAGPRADPAEEVFTKLNGGVPELVTSVLRIPPNSSLHFAGQFDSPYLLTNSGAEVARVLGELTNVSTILEAVREANRRRQSANSALKMRKADLELMKTGLKDYKDIPRKLEILGQAEKNLIRVEELQNRLDRLQSLMADQSVAEDILSRSIVQEPPTFDAIAAAHDRLSRYRELMGQLSRARSSQVGAQVREAAALNEIEANHTRLHETLLEAGTCPTCGAEITESSHV